ncbi:MAG: TIGR04219 family outer membrane beta-barrel protein [Sulfuricurvum sp.]|nr:TIGR04219 family outer membrane beta-barrel protein [Sulfuricurvum sp.]
MKIFISMCLAGSLASASMLVGFGAEVDYYHPTASGDFNYKTTSTHFNDDSQSGYQVGLYFEHPVPLIPNIRLDLTPEISFTGSNGGAGTNTVSINQSDITPYYEILDNVVDLDVGVSFKVLDVNIEGTGIAAQGLSEVIPMGYVAAGIDIPGVPLTIAGDVKYVEYRGDSFTDARIKAVLQIVAGLEAQAGYRYESLKISDHFDMRTDVEIKGPFIGLGYRF